MIFGQTMDGRAAGDAAGGAAPQARATAASRGATLGLGLVAIWAVLALVTLAPGALALTRHEGDATHLAAIVLRMADGQWPHLDFMTPIGIGALAPVAGGVALGAGLGTAFLAAQAAVAAALLPALWWVGTTRLGGGWLALAFGAVVLVLAMALVHGGAEASVAVSMHYNRWSWAVSYILLALVVLPAVRSAPRAEGLLLGLGFAFLALTKVTYFVGLAPVALFALGMRRAWVHLLWALAGGLAVALAVTAAAGPAFWPAYLGDLMAVATSESRPQPGLSAREVLSAPTHLGSTLVLLAAVAILRRNGHPTEGTLLLVALPGFTLITWQNFGNDPQWLPLLAVLLLALKPRGAAGQPYLAAALVAGALALPTMTNLATSPMRSMAAWTDESAPLLPRQPDHADLRIATKRLDRVMVTVPSPAFDEAAEPAFWGGTLPVCRMQHGGVRTYGAMARELEAAGYAGRRAFVADTMQALWLFGDFPKLRGGAPWYYGGLPGAADAEIVVVPLCAMAVSDRAAALAALEGSGWAVSEAFRGRHAVVLEIAGR